MKISRRVFFLGSVAALGLRPAFAAEKPLVKIYKDPTCGCCVAWAQHIQSAGYPVKIYDTGSIDAMKMQMGVPPHLQSCHTALVEDYVLEGHVPASALSKLLAEKPAIRGLAVAGMPIGSPGMEMPGRDAELFDVTAFGNGTSTFMRFRGHEAIAG